MGLDVAEVRTSFLDRPRGSAYRFAWYLAGEGDEGSWQVWSDGNAFMQFDYDRLLKRAEDYVSAEGLGAADAREVMGWAEGLPWRDGVVMLHMAW